MSVAFASPALSTTLNTTYLGKAEELIKNLPDNSVDCVITDPPYEIDMVRLQKEGWDRSGIAFSVDFWADVLRVLKPGGNLVAFAHARTSARMSVAIEDAGFEIRDTMMAWLYGSTMPRSLDIAKDLRMRGFEDIADNWEGWETNLKPAYEPIVMARKPLEGTTAQNVAQWGVGGLNIDVCRIPTEDDRSRIPGDTDAHTFKIQRGHEASTSHPEGRWPTNILLCHHPLCEDDSCHPDCHIAVVDSQGNKYDPPARFFPQFRYSGKARGKERPVVNGVSHTTIKPLAIMDWIVALTARPGMVVLDMFAGSGATVESCAKAGIETIAFEMREKCIPLIEFRLDRVA